MEERCPVALQTCPVSKYAWNTKVEGYLEFGGLYFGKGWLGLSRTGVVA